MASYQNSNHTVEDLPNKPEDTPQIKSITGNKTKKSYQKGIGPLGTFSTKTLNDEVFGKRPNNPNLVRSSFFQTLGGNQAKPSPGMSKKASIMKLKLTQNDQQDIFNAPAFSNTVFNPKTKFFGQTETNFFLPIVSKTLNESKSSKFRIRTKGGGTGPKVKEKTDENFYDPFKIVDNANEEDFHSDLYARNNPLSNNLRMTSSLFNLMKQKEKRETNFKFVNFQNF